MVNSAQPLHEETQEPDAREQLGRNLKQLLAVTRPIREALREAQLATPPVDQVAEAHRIAQRDTADVLKQVNIAMQDKLDAIDVTTTGFDAIPMRVAHVDSAGITTYWHFAGGAPHELLNGLVQMVATYKRGQFLGSRRAAAFGMPRETRYGIDDEVFE